MNATRVDIVIYIVILVDASMFDMRTCTSMPGIGMSMATCKGRVLIVYLHDHGVIRNGATKGLFLRQYFEWPPDSRLEVFFRSVPSCSWKEHANQRVGSIRL